MKPLLGKRLGECAWGSRFGMRNFFGVSYNASAALRRKATRRATRWWTSAMIGCTAAAGNSLSLAPAARDSSLAREPFVVPPGQSGMEKKSAAEKYSPTTWILWYPAPSRGSCREAEGVAFRPCRDRRVALRGSCHRPHQGHNDAASHPPKKAAVQYYYTAAFHSFQLKIGEFQRNIFTFWMRGNRMLVCSVRPGFCSGRRFQAASYTLRSISQRHCL